MLRVSDVISGLAIAGIGAAVLIESREFSQVGGIAISPSFYPGIIGAVLMVCGLALIVTAIVKKKVFPLADPVGWLRRPWNMAAVIAVPMAIILYSLLSVYMGFLLTCTLVLAGLLMAFQIRIVPSLLISIITTVLLYAIFVNALRVPLPFGVIEALLQ